MESLVSELVMQAFAGLSGGVVVGLTRKASGLGTAVGAFIGMIGGIALAQAVALLVATVPTHTDAGTTISGLLRHVVIGLLGGAVLTAAVSAIRTIMLSRRPRER